MQCSTSGSALAPRSLTQDSLHGWRQRGQHSEVHVQPAAVPSVCQLRRGGAAGGSMHVSGRHPSPEASRSRGTPVLRHAGPLLACPCACNTPVGEHSAAPHLPRPEGVPLQHRDAQVRQGDDHARGASTLGRRGLHHAAAGQRCALQRRQPPSVGHHCRSRGRGRRAGRCEGQHTPQQYQQRRLRVSIIKSKPCTRWSSSPLPPSALPDLPPPHVGTHPAAPSPARC